MKCSYISPFLFGIFFSFLILGCTINGNVTDFNRKTIKVNAIHLSDPGKLKVHDGNTFIELPLNRVRILRIQSDVSTIIDRELYCLAEIVFRDGTSWGSFENDNQKIYVASNYYIYGKTQNGIYRTMLNSISKIELTD